MKKLFSILAMIVLTTEIFAQSPEKMSYQAVIRDAGNELVRNKPVGMQISILQGTTPVYVETQTPTTNANGLISIEIGSGLAVSGSFAAIDWSAGQYFIKTETDPDGASNYTITGTSQLLSVPYALHAKTADTVMGMLTTETDPVYTASEAAKVTAKDITNLRNLSGVNTGDQDVSGIARNTKAIQDTAAKIRADMPKFPSGSKAGDILYWDGGKWVMHPIGNQGQVLTVCGGELVWTTNGLCPAPPFACGKSTVTFTYKGSQVTYGTVESKTGKCWLDRNLGASQVATAVNDDKSYGDYFQWGRGDDGHQDKSSGVTTTLSTTDVPGHSDLINTNTGNWRSPRNDALWQGSNGINNPCPPGFHVPTKDEWDDEVSSWNIPPNLDNAFGSALKLPAAGYRRGAGTLGVVGTAGRYWGSTTTGADVYTLTYDKNGTSIGKNSRSNGFSVRCIKD